MNTSLLSLVRRACRGDGEADAALVRRFARARDEGAFAELLCRHGALVYGLARRWLASEQDAEDCFQAAFLTLARKADSVRNGQALAGWLYRVTRRLALRMRAQNAARPRAVPLGDVPAMDTRQDSADLRELLAAELERLPDKYAAPLVMHYLEGKTLAETARQLGWKQGTVSGRLSRALALLRGRLGRRGVTLPAAALASLAPEAVASPALGLTTARAVAAFVAGDASALAPHVIRLSDGVLPMMASAKTRFVVGLCALLLCAGAGLTVVAAGATSGEDAPPAKPVPPKAEPAARPAQAAAPAAEKLPEGAVARLGRPRGRKLHDLTAAVKAVAFTTDGKLLATTDGYNGITVWDVASGEQYRVVPVKAHLYGLSFSPDGKRIAWGGNAGVAVFGVSEVASGLPVWRANGGNRVAWAPDGRHVICGGYGSTPLVADAGTGRVVHTLEEKGWRAVWTAVSLDATTVAVAAERVHDPRQAGAPANRVEVWDVAAGRLRDQLTPPQHDYSRVQSVMLSPDGKTVGIAQQSRFTLIDAAAGQVSRQFDLPAHTYWTFADYPPAGDRLLAFRSGFTPQTGGHTTSIHLFDPMTGKELRRFEGASYQFGAAAFAPDGKRVVSFGESVALHVWDVDTGRVLPAYDGHRVAPDLLALDAEGKTLASADRLHSVCVWDVRRQALRRRLDLGPARHIELAPDGKSLLVSTREHGVLLYDLTDGSARGLHRQALLATRTPDGTHVAYAEYGSGIQIIEAATGKKVQRCEGHRGEMRSLSFSRDGARLLSAARTVTGGPAEVGFRKRVVLVPDDTVRLWDVTRGKQLHQWNVRAEAAALSPDGQTVLVGDARGTLRRFEAGGRELDPLDGHQAAVRQVFFTHDGKQILSRDNVGRVLVWDAATGKELHAREPAPGGTGTIAVSGDGRRIATAGGDPTILVWDLARPE